MKRENSWTILPLNSTNPRLISYTTDRHSRNSRMDLVWCSRGSRYRNLACSRAGNPRTKPGEGAWLCSNRCCSNKPRLSSCNKSSRKYNFCKSKWSNSSKRWSSSKLTCTRPSAKWSRKKRRNCRLCRNSKLRLRKSMSWKT